MPLTPEQTQANVAWVQGEFITEATAVSEDPEVRKSALVESLRRASQSKAEFAASGVRRGDLLGFEIKIEAKDGTSKTSTFAKRPTAGGLLMLLGSNCVHGDKVTVTTLLVGGKAVASNHWPLSLAVAADMVADHRGTDLLESSDAKKNRLRKLGPLGTVCVSTSHGPPRWNLPRPRFRLKRGESGSQRYMLYAAIGWLYRGIEIAWTIGPEPKK